MDTPPTTSTPQTLGVNVYQAAPNGLQMSEGKFNIGGGTNSVAHFNDNTLSFDDDVTWVRGRHQLIFGGEWVQNQLNIGNVYEGNGIFTFNGQYSGSGPNGGSTIGDQNLDFLQGTLGAMAPASFPAEQAAAERAARHRFPASTFRTPIHATPRLTLVARPALGTQLYARRLFQSRRRVQHGRLPRRTR